MTTVNLAQLYNDYKREDEITLLEGGTYKLEVIRATVRHGGKGPGILPVFKVAEGPYAGKTAMCGQFTASPDGRSIFFRQMAGFGLGEDFFAQGATIEQAAEALKGRVVEAQVTQREWNGRPRNNIAIGGIKLISVPSGAPAPANTAAPAAAPAAAPPQMPAAPAAPAPDAAVALPPMPAASGTPASF